MKKLFLVAALCLGLLAPASAVVQGTQVGNANYTILNTDTVIRTTTAFSTSRTWTLPFAAGSCVGQNCKPFTNELVIIDAASAITSSNTLVLARQSGDTINGAAADLTITTAGVQIVLIPTSPNNWQAYTIGSSGGNVGPLTVTTLTADAIAGGDASLGITGLAAAQGGTVAITGGTSSTASNAGGPVTITGGTPGASGIGGAVTFAGAAGLGGAVGGAATLTAGAGQGTGDGAIAGLVGGASGAGATGAGGVSRVIGGASAATDGAGGAAQLTGGLGKGTGAGGKAQVTGGAAGATGTGGAVELTGGAATAGVGGAVTISAGASAGGTNNGAVVNLVPSAAVSTGVPGTVQVNGNSSLICATFYTQGAPAANTDTVFFVATRPLFLVSASQVHSVAAGGTSTAQITKDTSTDAPGAGTDLLSAAFNLNATANTVQTGSLIATVASKTFAAGDRLAVDFADAVQSSAGIAITACFAPL